ncbi:hypothetical protein ACP275_04G210000 [Erythranthe tilingii]
MNPILIGRRILQESDVDSSDGIDPYTSITAAVRRPFDTTAPFNSSMALTILVLLTVLFFIFFFSIYIRRFATATAAADDLPPPPRSCGNRKGGLDAAAVDSLPLVAYGGGAASSAAKHHHRRPMIDDCPICLSEFREREAVKLIPYCGHVFHPGCIDTWLASHVTCPLCRSAQLFKSVEEVCLDVTGDREIGERSSVEGDDTCTIEGPHGATATCTCSNSSNRTVLERSTSF